MKIGIIGAGISGLTAAWLLDKDFEITLFEQRDRIGGHAHTCYIEDGDKTIPIETGFEFFNKKMFPNFFKILKILNIPTRDYSFTYTFFTNDRELILPPIQNGHVFWNSFTPRNIVDLIQLKYLINNSFDIVKFQNITTTLKEFTDKLWLSKKFKDNLFFPLFCAGWGANHQEFRNDVAYNLLSWIIKNHEMGMQPSVWSEVTDGATSYINAMRKQINKAEIKLNSSISNITYEGKNYIIHTNDGIYECEHLILATNAYQANNLLKNIEHVHDLKFALNKIEYLKATIAVHEDKRFMPQKEENWSVANVCYNDLNSTLTVYKKWKSERPFFRSWLFPSMPTPEKIHCLQHYYHARPNINYFEAQNLISNLQGKQNIWLAGVYTYDIDSHESAIVSAIKIAQKLNPESERLDSLFKLGI